MLEYIYIKEQIVCKFHNFKYLILKVKKQLKVNQLKLHLHGINLHKMLLFHQIKLLMVMQVIEITLMNSILDLMTVIILEHIGKLIFKLLYKFKNQYITIVKIVVKIEQKEIYLYFQIQIKIGLIVWKTQMQVWFKHLYLSLQFN